MYIVLFVFFFFFFKQKTAYEMRISDWSSDVCSSDLLRQAQPERGWGMTHAAPLVTPQPALAAALTDLLGGDLLAHVFTVDEDSITGDREAVAGVMIRLSDNPEYQQDRKSVV